MSTEIWKDIKDYEGLYQVSNLGRVRSLDRDTVFKDGRTRHFYGCIRSAGYNSSTGYKSVTLNKNGKKHSRDVHRLVAETFIQNPNNLQCVDHINGNKTDNRAENLRWCTQRENILYSIENGTFDIEKRIKVINDPAVREKMLKATRCPVIRSDGMAFKSMSDAARATGCSLRAIQSSISGKIKSCKGYSFRRMEKRDASCQN